MRTVHVTIKADEGLIIFIKGWMVVSTLIPLLFIILTLCLVGLLFWGFKRIRNYPATTSWLEPGDHFQVWLLILAGFTMGIFLIYLLFTLPVGTR
jgi:hypothetical protein